MPDPVASAPAVTEVDSLNNSVFAGEVGKKVSGRMAHGGQAVALGFAGDAGYWIVAAGAEDALAPGELDFDAKLDFASTLEAVPRDLLLSAVDGDGRFGAPSTLPLTVRTVGTGPAPSLQVKLTWDTEADLDLHLELPDGTVVWAHNINSYQAPPPPELPDPLAPGGILDLDSNAGCVIDGRREENVSFAGATPAGHYRVRVDAFSMCGQVAARWQVSVSASGSLIESASGLASDVSAAVTHDAAAGVLALEFEIQ